MSLTSGLGHDPPKGDELEWMSGQTSYLQLYFSLDYVSNECKI